MIAAWHDVECASYGADLPLWRELAEERGSPVLDIGAGTGRVALDLAARGHAVVALDADPELVEVCAARARERDLPVRAHPADARSFDLGALFPLAILPMQVAQLLGGPAGRAAMLAAARAHLEPGGTAGGGAGRSVRGRPGGRVPAPLPDVLEVDGWVLSSTPVDVRDEAEHVSVDRHRQAVSPKGDLSEEVFTLRLDSVTSPTLEAEGIEAGFTPLAPREVPDTRDYVGSTVVMLEAPR